MTDLLAPLAFLQPAAMPVPRDLPLPLPLPELWLKVMIVPVFLLHILFVNLTVGAAIFTVIFEYAGFRDSRYDRLALAVCRSITINKSLAVVLGIAPLLIINLLYTTQFYAANALTGHAWVLLIPLISLAFLLSYLHQYSWASWTGRRKARHWLTGLSSAALFLAIPLIFLSNVNLMLLPETWSQASGFFRSLQFGNVFPRYLHFLGASITLTALYLAWSLGRRAPDDEAISGFAPSELIRKFYTWALALTALQLFFGPLLLLTLDWSHVSPLLLLLLCLALLFVIPAVWLLAREVRQPVPSLGWRYPLVLASLAATVLGMGTIRHLYRENAVAQHREKVAERTAEFASIEGGTQMRLRAGLGVGESSLGPRSGETVFKQICGSCHDPTEQTNAPSLKEIQSIYKDNPDGIIKWAKAPGKKRAQFQAMPSMAHLEEEELRRVAQYMLRLGVSAPPKTPSANTTD